MVSDLVRLRELEQRVEAQRTLLEDLRARAVCPPLAPRELMACAHCPDGWVTKRADRLVCSDCGYEQTL